MEVWNVQEYRKGGIANSHRISLIFSGFIVFPTLRNLRVFSIGVATHYINGGLHFLLQDRACLVHSNLFLAANGIENRYHCAFSIFLFCRERKKWRKTPNFALFSLFPIVGCGLPSLILHGALCLHSLCSCRYNYMTMLESTDQKLLIVLTIVFPFSDFFCKTL